MKAIRLRTEYLRDPLGIDLQHCRLMWNCAGGVKQTAYRIVTENWDSGRVESASMHSVYPLPLHSRHALHLQQLHRTASYKYSSYNVKTLIAFFLY